MRRPGFTLIELLVVVGVVGLLASLLMPAVQAAREGASAISCRSKLKNITLAYANYVATHGMNPGWYQRTYLGPPGRLTEDQIRYRLQGPSLLAQLLPHLSEAAVYDAVNFSLVGLDDGFALARDDVAANQTVAARALGIFLCPSDSGKKGSNYRGCLGVGPAIHRTREFPDSSNGLFASKGILNVYSVTEADVSDGLSHTAAFSEHLLSVEGGKDLRRTAYVYAFSYGARSGDEIAQVCHAVAQFDEPATLPVRPHWLFTGLHQTLYTHALPPNSRIPDCFNTGVVPYFGASAARSNHPGVVNVAFADGSVRAVGDNVSLAVWRALATRDESDDPQGL